KTIRASWPVQNRTLRLPFEHFQSLSIACCSDPTHKPRRALVLRHTPNFAHQLGVIRFVIGIGFGSMRFVSGVSGGMYSRSAAERIYFQSGIVSNYQFFGSVTAVRLGFFARIGFEGKSVLDHRRQGRKIRKLRDL